MFVLRRLADVPTIQQPERTSFGTWLKRIEGQGRSKVTRRSLSYLTLLGVNLFSQDLVQASLVCSDSQGTYANFLGASFGSLSSANFKNASLIRSADPRFSGQANSFVILLLIT